MPCIRHWRSKACEPAGADDLADGRILQGKIVLGTADALGGCMAVEGVWTARPCKVGWKCSRPVSAKLVP